MGSSSLYQYGPAAPGGIRLAMGGPGADSVTAMGFAAGIRGAHLYVAGGNGPRVYGVFTIGTLPPALVLPLPAVFVLRYRPAAALACHDLLRRTTSQEPWAFTGTRRSADGLALRLPVVQPHCEIQLIAAPPSYLYVTGDTLLCPGGKAALRAVAPVGARLRWNTGDTTATIMATSPGRYTVTSAPTASCPARQSSIEVQAELPAAPFTLGPDTTLCEGTSLLLAGPAHAGLRYAWADGPTTRTRTVDAAGTYTLRVQARCGPPQSAQIRVMQRECFRVPTVITPNGDGRNDRFVIQEALPSTWQLTLHNRWGRVVLQTTSYRHDWGADAAPGLYYVLLRNPGTGYTYKGWLEVLR